MLAKKLLCFLKFLPRHTFIVDYKWTHYLSSSLASGPNYPKLILVPDKDTGKLAIDLLGQSGARDEGKHNKQQRWAGQFGQWQLLRLIGFEIVPPSPPPSVAILQNPSLQPKADMLHSATSTAVTCTFCFLSLGGGMFCPNVSFFCFLFWSWKSIIYRFS